MKINRHLEFSLKLMTLIILVSFLIFDFLLQIYSPKTNMRGIPALQRLDIYYAFFTTQSNYAVVMYLTCAVLMKKINNKQPPFGVELAMTVYITVTMLVFWSGLLASPDELKSYQTVNWISTVILHLCIPVLMIGYFLISCGDAYIGFREHSRFNLVATCFYPAGYLIFIMIRGHFRYQLYGPDQFSQIYYYNKEGDLVNIWNQIPNSGTIDTTPYTSQMWYPYWFMDFHRYNLEIGKLNEEGKIIGSGEIVTSHMHPSWLLILTFVFACFAIAFLVVSLQFLYLHWNNGKFYRWHDINGKLISKHEHDYRLAQSKLKKAHTKNLIKQERVRKKSDYRSWIKTLQSLEKVERKEAIVKYRKQKLLAKKLKAAQIKQEKVNTKNQKSQIKKWLATSVKWVDRGFVKENLREADRYKKLVKKGVLVYRTEYNDE